MYSQERDVCPLLLLPAGNPLAPPGKREKPKPQRQRDRPVRSARAYMSRQAWRGKGNLDFPVPVGYNLYVPHNGEK